MIEERKRTIRQRCPCGNDEAAQVLTFVMGLMTADTSSCAACGKVLWEWTWESSMAAAREARAFLASRTAPEPVSTPARAAKKEQLSLW